MNSGLQDIHIFCSDFKRCHRCNIKEAEKTTLKRLITNLVIIKGFAPEQTRSSLRQRTDFNSLCLPITLLTEFKAGNRLYDIIAVKRMYGRRVAFHSHDRHNKTI